jgi:uncharacterized protein YpmB
MQIIIVIIAILLAIAYALWRIYSAIQRANDPCIGCAGCALKDVKQQMKYKKRQKPDCYKENIKNGH